jgi:hypothetical protein
VDRDAGGTHEAPDQDQRDDFAPSKANREATRNPDLFDLAEMDAPESRHTDEPLVRGGAPASSSMTGDQAAKRRADRSRRRPRSDAASTPASDGADLERRVARLEFAEGALARLRVPVFVDAEAGRDILTDLDVLSFDLDNRLRLSRSTLECKSGRGQSGEGDRLLWLAGLRTLLGVERAVLVRQTITRRGRALAGSLGLQILDVPTLAQREAGHAWLPDQFAHIDGPACIAGEARTDVQLRGLGHIPSDLVAFLRHQSLLAPSHRSLAALAALRSAVEHGGVLPTPTRPILAGHALLTLTLAALQDAAMLDTVPATQLQRRIELALTVGSPDDDHVLSVLGRADQVVGRVVDGIHRAYIERGADRIDLPAPSLRQLVAAPPGWVARYIDLTQRLRANPDVARQLPQTVELACFDALLGDSAYLAAAFDHLFTIEHRSLLTACVRMLADVAGAHLADAIGPITALDYSRSTPAVPDRTATAERSGTATPPTPPPARRRVD